MIAMLKRIKYSLVLRFLRCCPDFILDFLFRRKRGTIVLLYHRITSADTYFATTESALQAHIDYLEKNGCIFISPDKLHTAAHSSERLRVCLTFDDGYRELSTIVNKLFFPRQIPCTIFLAPLLHSSGSPDLLSTTEIQHLGQNPFVTIGSHGLTHLAMDLLSRSGLSFELKESRRQLEALTGCEVSFLAYPFGIFTPDIKTEACRYYRTAFAAHETCGGNHAYPRTSIDRGSETLRQFKIRILQGYYDHD